MKERIIKLLSKQLGFDPDKIKPETHLENDLNTDSLDLVEFVMGLEEEFNIEILDEDAEKFVTVQDIFDYMEGRVI